MRPPLFSDGIPLLPYGPPSLLRERKEAKPMDKPMETSRNHGQNDENPMKNQGRPMQAS